MTWEEIIYRFRLQVDDGSELSSDEELALLNQCYRELQNDRDWEWLITQYTGTQSVSVPYIDLPADFKKLSANYNWITQWFGNAWVPIGFNWFYLPINISNTPVVFVGTQYEPYEVVSFSNRRNHRDQSNVCYIDVPNQRLYFTIQPTTAQSVEYDYIKRAAALTTATEPLFNDAYHEILAYAMAAKFDPIQLTAKDWMNYMTDNQRQYFALLEQMAVEDANIKLVM